MHSWLSALGEGVNHGKQWCLGPFPRVGITLCAIRSPHLLGLFISRLFSPVTTPTNNQAIRASHGLWIHALFLALPLHNESSKACLCLVWNYVHCWLHFLLICVHYFLWLCFAFVFFPRVSDAWVLASKSQENIFKCQTSQQWARIEKSSWMSASFKMHSSWNAVQS